MIHLKQLFLTYGVKQLLEGSNQTNEISKMYELTIGISRVQISDSQTFLSCGKTKQKLIQKGRFVFLLTLFQTRISFFYTKRLRNLIQNLKNDGHKSHNRILFKFKFQQ